jgi:hypothetical protein
MKYFFTELCAILNLQGCKNETSFFYFVTQMYLLQELHSIKKHTDIQK